MPERETDNPANGTDYRENYALYNAPPGTLQKMSVFFYATPDGGEATRKAALAFTHDDTFKPIDGYKTFVNHFHLQVTDRMRVGGFDTPLQDLMAMKALGLNVIGLSDFHADRLAGNDYGPARFKDQKDYAEASRRLSDKDFLVLPWEEPSVAFGGHYNALWPKSVLWSKTNTTGGGRGGRGGRGGQAGAPAAPPTALPFTENDPTYGKVYHTGSAEAMQRLLDAEGGYWYHAHPRTKSTANYPDAIWDRDYIKNDRYLGVAFKPGMGMDLSDKTLCEYRCFDTIDTMNNAFASLGIAPKYVIADIDTYRKGPEDDLYANFPVNYLKIGTTPGPDQDWSPVLKALRDGNFFGTTGEILIKDYAVTGTGKQRTITADAEWTFPLAFVQVVSGDGKTVTKQVIPATDLAAFGSKKFVIPFDATGKVVGPFLDVGRAGNGAFVQPVWLK